MPESHFNTEEEDYSSPERMTVNNKSFPPSSYIAMKLRLSDDKNLNQSMICFSEGVGFFNKKGIRLLSYFFDQPNAANTITANLLGCQKA